MKQASRVLKHLDYAACPTCGAGIAREEFTGRVHVNGQQFESISFLCGATIEWIPNFERADKHKDCPKSPSAMAEGERRKVAHQAIVGFIGKLGGLTGDELAEIQRALKAALRQ